MLSNNLVAKNAAGETETFALVKYLPDGSARLAASSTLSEPYNLTIRHTSSGANGSTLDRHLVSSTLTVLDANGKPISATVNTTFTIPRNPAITTAMVAEMHQHQVSLIVDETMLATGIGASGAANFVEISRGAA